MWGDRRRILRAFGRRVRALRELAGLGEDALARRLEVTSDVVQRVEVGTAYVSIFTIVRLAQALGVEPADLLRLEADDDSNDSRLRRTG